MNYNNHRQFLINYAIDQMTDFLMEDRKITLGQALDLIYTSKTYDFLLDESIDLTSDSPSYIYELLKREISES